MHIKLNIYENINSNSQELFIFLKKKNEQEYHFANKKEIFLSILEEKYNSPLDFEYLGGNIFNEIISYGNNFNLDLTQFDNDEAAFIINGLYLRSWSFNDFKKNFKKIENISIKVQDALKTKEIFNKIKKTSDGIIFSQKICALPPNILTPEKMLEEITNLFKKEENINIKILDKLKIKNEKLNLIDAVAKGSKNNPYVVIIEKGNLDMNNICLLLGKGVTFDTGGISLKSSDSMIDMKKDMAGAANVIATVYASSVPVVAIVGLVENMIGSNAMKVSDIYTSKNGHTVEVLNTDAEGRLILADLLSYGEEIYKPKEIIDVATLTGAANICLGKEYAPIMGNNKKLISNLINSGNIVGELLWELPCNDYYNHHLESKIADIKNIGTRGESGTIAGGKFIEFFLKNKAIKWAHIDIAATISKETILCKEFTNGFGIRLLTYYLENFFLINFDFKNKNCCKI